MFTSAAHNRGAFQPKYANPYGNSAHCGPNQFQTHGQMYAQNQPVNLQHESNGVSLDNLAQNFGSLGLRAADPGHSMGSGRLKENMVPTNMVNLSTIYANQPNGHFFYPLTDGGLMLSGMSATAGSYQQYPGYSLPPPQSTHIPQAAYNAFPINATQTMPNTPQGQTWLSSQHLPRDVPGLVAPRRNSWSSTEETGPQTPLYSVPGQAAYQPAVLFNDQSPHWTTPSPQQVDQSYIAQYFGKAKDGHYTFMDFAAIAQQDPPIPRAIPAPFSPNDGRGTLDKIFDNPYKTTNVYIRGLPPNTSDKMLEQYGARFGDIVTAKSIIDHPTDLCKGSVFS